MLRALCAVGALGALATCGFDRPATDAGLGPHDGVDAPAGPADLQSVTFLQIENADLTYDARARIDTAHLTATAHIFNLPSSEATLVARFAVAPGATVAVNDAPLAPGAPVTVTVGMPTTVTVTSADQQAMRAYALTVVPVTSFFVSDTTPEEPSATSIAIGQLGEDRDLVVGDSGQLGVRVTSLLGAGSSFSFGDITLQAAQTVGVAIADYDHDGALDIIAAGNPSSGTAVTVFAHRDNFVPTSLGMRFGDALTGLAVADFNGDGLADLAVSSAASGAVVALNGGSGAPSVGASTTLTNAVGDAIAAGDLDGDGLPDLAVAVTVATGGQVDLLLDGTQPTGVPAFGPLATAGLGAPVAALAIGDYNADGLADVAVLTTDHALTVLVARGSGAYDQTTITGLAGSPVAFASGDLDGDGVPDLVVGETLAGNAAPAVLIATPAPAGSIAFAIVSEQPIGSIGPISAVAIGDADGDGLADFAVVTSDNSTLITGLTRP